MADEEIRLLFVCSGNTCRSPMAAALARHFATSRPASARRIVAASAGISAEAGLPMTPEAVAALRRLGVDPGPHRSRLLARGDIADADRIFCMTPVHRQAVLALDPSAAARTETLDRAGAGVPDPVGGTQPLYDETARLLAGLVAQRIQELDR